MRLNKRNDENQRIVSTVSHKSETKPKLILASLSPRRIDLLRNLGLEFEIIGSEADESYPPHLKPEEVVVHVARNKALEVFHRLMSSAPGTPAGTAAGADESVGTASGGDGESVGTAAGDTEKSSSTVSGTNAATPLVVLGADTMVVLHGDLLGKPGSKEEAVEMLNRLQGRPHLVHTGLVVLTGTPGKTRYPEEFQAVETSKVYFRTLDQREIEAYVETKEPMDKAGAYALQGIGAALVEKIEGCVSNIIGLPVPKSVEILRKAGINILGLP